MTTQTIIPSEERLRPRPGFRIDWSGLRNRLDEAISTIEKQETYEMRSAHLDALARVFEDGIQGVIDEERSRTSSAVPAVGEAVAWRVEHGGGATFWNVEANAVSNAKATGGTVQPLYDRPLPSTEPSEAMRAAWERGRRGWCPAGILADKERTERDWLSALPEIRAALNESQSK